MTLITEKLKNLIFLCILSTVFFSCKKERTIRITATNVATGERIPYLHYYIVQLTEGLNGEKATTVGEGDLNANGEANVTMKLKKTTHVVRVVEPENSCYTENISLTFGSEDFNAAFKFAPCGFLQSKIHNVSCIDSDDKIIFDFTPVNIPTYDNISPQTKYGCYENEYIDSNVPSGPWKAEWQVTKGGITTTYDSTFVINENQHYYFLLEY